MQLDGFLTFEANLSTQVITTAAAGTDVTIPPRKKVCISSPDSKLHFLFSTDGTNAAATDPIMPAGAHVMNSGHYTKLSLFNPSASSITVSVTSWRNV